MWWLIEADPSLTKDIEGRLDSWWEGGKFFASEEDRRTPLTGAFAHTGGLFPLSFPNTCNEVFWISGTLQGATLEINLSLPFVLGVQGL